MREPRLNQRLFESEGETAYLREAAAATNSESRAHIRDAVRRISAAACAAFSEPALKKTISRYPIVIADLLGSCYLLAYNEAWEGIDRESFTAKLCRAADEYRQPEDAEDRAYLIALGLASGAKGFAEARVTLADLPSTKRMGFALRSMIEHSGSIPGIKRRHRDDYLQACESVMGIGCAVGVLDALGLVPV